MRILRIIASMDPRTGGPSQGIRHSIAEMAKKNIVNDVVCLDNPDEEYLANKSDNFNIYALGSGRTAWHYNPKLYAWLLANLINYDSVIVHGLWLYHGYAAYQATKQLNKQNAKTHLHYRRIKFFVMPHGMLDPYFQKAGSRKLKAIRNFFYWYLVESKVIGAAEGVLFTSKSELELAKETFSYYKPKQVHNVGYGIPAPPINGDQNTSVFRNTIDGLESRPYILFLSRIHEKKGLDLLIEAYKFQLLQKSTSGQHDIDKLPCLVIAGPGWGEPFGQKISGAISADSIFKNRVFTTGMVSGATKWSALMDAEVFILPSHQENFGIAVAEALACAKPVLITKQINIWREIKQYGAGIVKSDNIDGVRDLLTEWFNLDVSERDLMSKNALKCFNDLYDICKPTENLIKAIKPGKSL